MFVRLVLVLCSVLFWSITDVFCGGVKALWGMDTLTY